MTAVDDYSEYGIGLDSPYGRAAAVTPSDTVSLTDVTRGLYIGGTGSLAVITAGGDTVTLSAVPVGVMRLRVSQVKATGTTATNIVALW